ELLWATLTVSNTNDHDLKWTAGGCRILGLVEALPLLPDAGRHWPGALGTFKAWALKYPESYAYFADETSWAHRGGACPAAQFTEILPAGATLAVGLERLHLERRLRFSGCARWSDGDRRVVL